jgi:hypothetical protein
LRRGDREQRHADAALAPPHDVAPAARGSKRVTA